jgi:hypothetical protein
VNAPLPESAALSAVDRARRQADVAQALGSALPAHALLWRAEDTGPYECDGLTAYREKPLVVALPESEAQVAAVLRICHRLGVPVVARGRRHGPVGRRPAARTRRDAEPGQVQPHRAHRRPGADGHRAERRPQPRHQRSGGAARPLLRARPEQPDRLHDRRQRRRELGRRALPQVRA